MNTIERQTWLSFYQTAEQFRDLAPWNWLGDRNIFGVQDPASDLIYYCCIMGAGGEVFAIGMYPGEPGIQSYLNLAYSGDGAENEIILAVLRQLLIKVEFVDRQEMSPQELGHLKSLGLAYRGKRQWIKAEDCRPGYLPELISVEQAQVATRIMKQAMVAARRLRDTPGWIERSEYEFLLLTPTNHDGSVEWQETWHKFPDEDYEPSLPVDLAEVATLNKKLKKIEGALLFSLQYMPNPIAESKKRPYFALNGIWINYSNGVITGFDLYKPDSLQVDFEKNLYKQFKQLRIIPGQIVVDSRFAESMLEPFCEALGIDLIYDPEVPVFAEVTNMMRQMPGMG